MKCRKARRFFIHALLPVALGAALYYLFCPDTLFVRAIDHLCGGGLHFQVNAESFAVKMIRNYFMDFAWAYSFLSFVLIVFEDAFSLKTLFIMIALFEVFLELVQIFPFVMGTFDIFDIAAEIIANILVIHFLSRRKCIK